jgi:hypothetical protein
MSDFKRAVSLIKYGIKPKLTIGSALVMFVVGLAFEIVQNLFFPEVFYDPQNGAAMMFPIGGLFMAIIPMYFPQVLMGLNLAGYVSSSGFSKKMLYDIPVRVYCVMTMFSYTVVVLLRLAVMHSHPEYEIFMKMGVIELAIIMLVINIYTATVFKYYIISIIIFLVCYLGIYFPMVGVGPDITKILMDLCNKPFGVMVAVGYAIVAISLVIYVAISRALFRVPVSPKIFRTYFKKF